MTKNTRFSPEVRQRAVRMVLECQDGYDSQWAALSSIAPKIGCTPETLRIWLRQYERDAGGGDSGLSTTERPPLEKITLLVDTLSDEYGVGPVCHELDIAPSSYYRHREHQLHPDKRSHRDRRDDQLKLKLEIQRVYDENYGVYGVR